MGYQTSLRVATHTTNCTGVLPGALVAGQGPATLQTKSDVEGVRLAYAQRPDLLNGWCVEMYGKGVQLEQVRIAISRAGMRHLIKLTHAPSMHTVFAGSRVFVSTQDFENFTSLSMQEAMAAGNAIIARNVGQTSWYLRDAENGFMMRHDSPQGLADALFRYVSEADQHENFALRSQQIATVEHSVNKFVVHLERFWRQVALRTCQ